MAFEIVKSKHASIVQYDNNFNKLRLNEMNDLEQDLLFNIIANIRNQEDENVFVFGKQTLLSYVPKNITEFELLELAKSLKYKFFKIDFACVTKEKQVITEEFINLFKRYKIVYTSKNEEQSYEEFTKEDLGEFLSIEIEINPMFRYLIADVFSIDYNGKKQGYTAFEIKEFVKIRGLYAKTLYRFLKQYKFTGVFSMAWKDFVSLMNFPKTFNAYDIERTINLAIKLLTQINAYNGTEYIIKKPAFKNVVVKYNRGLNRKGEAKKRGEIHSVTFYFDAEYNFNKISFLDYILAFKNKELDLSYFLEGAGINFQKITIKEVYADSYSNENFCKVEAYSYIDDKKTFLTIPATRTLALAIFEKEGEISEGE